MLSATLWIRQIVCTVTIESDLKIIIMPDDETKVTHLFSEQTDEVPLADEILSLRILSIFAVQYNLENNLVLVGLLFRNNTERLWLIQNLIALSICEFKKKTAALNIIFLPMITYLEPHSLQNLFSI